MIRINDSKSKTTLKAAVLLSVFLLFAVVTGFGQQVNLTAGPTTTTLPDGTVLPMWGYTCGAAVTGVDRDLRAVERIQLPAQPPGHWVESTCSMADRAIRLRHRHHQCPDRLTSPAVTTSRRRRPRWLAAARWLAST